MVTRPLIGYSLIWLDPILHRGVITFSISTPREKGLGEFTLCTCTQANGFRWALILSAQDFEIRELNQHICKCENRVHTVNSPRPFSHRALILEVIMPLHKNRV